ncbi:hypothetical protein [Shouchella lehensis]|uniref:Uncharacterized protein n=1 Tax=Shouchella lehensis G1 TaxID=1246626 RepID=A0A060LVV8_9BACI|nr:hypothetical protein [Shouchella lehensis]AIC94337.1 hypothetical protein BleG1_1759 [Shouchella lehensis G1]
MTYEKLRLLLIIGFNIFSIFVLIYHTFMQPEFTNDSWVINIGVLVSMMLFFNFILFIHLLLSELLYKFVDKLNKKKFNAMNWLTTPKHSTIYSDLRNLRLNRDADYQENKLKVKKCINETFVNNEDLINFKKTLSIHNDSSRLVSLKNVVISILSGAITAIVVFIINSNQSQLPTMISVIALLFFLILIFLSFINNEIDRGKFILQVVEECLWDREKLEKRKKFDKQFRDYFL